MTAQQAAAVLELGIDSAVFSARSKIISGHAFKKLPGITVGNIEDATYKNPNKKPWDRKDKTKDRLTHPYVVYFVAGTGAILVQAADSLEELKSHIESRIRTEEFTRNLVLDTEDQGA